MKLVYTRNKYNSKNIVGSDMEIYSDSTWVDDEWDGKSTTGMAVIQSGNLISWMCEKQHTQALSSAEAEYMAACNAGQETYYFYQLYDELKMDTEIPYTIYIDNTGAALIAENDINNRYQKPSDLVRFLLRSYEPQSIQKC